MNAERKRLDAEQEALRNGIKELQDKAKRTDLTDAEKKKLFDLKVKNYALSSGN